MALTCLSERGAKTATEKCAKERERKESTTPITWH